jgi:hypothetical protein
MKPLLPIFLLIVETGFSQGNLDFGEVNGKSIKTCLETTDGKICRSKNYLEICLSGASLLALKYKTVILSNDGLKWSAIMYKGDWSQNRIDTFILNPVTTFDTIFAKLKSNRIFTLPDQKGLKTKGSVDDGTDYQLTFKAGDRFRSYEFRNPDIFIKYNKDVPEFANYVNIVEILFNDLKSK